MYDFLMGIIETVEREYGPLPTLTSAQLKQAAHKITEKAKAMQPVVTSCPHTRICRADEKHEYLGWKCWDCGVPVHPDPEGLEHGFIEYGRKL